MAYCRGCAEGSEYGNKTDAFACVAGSAGSRQFWVHCDRLAAGKSCRDGHKTSFYVEGNLLLDNVDNAAYKTIQQQQVPSSRRIAVVEPLGLFEFLKETTTREVIIPNRSFVICSVLSTNSGTVARWIDTAPKAHLWPKSLGSYRIFFTAASTYARHRQTTKFLNSIARLTCVRF